MVKGNLNMIIFNFFFFIIGYVLVNCEQIANTSSIYIFNYHNTVDNRTNLTTDLINNFNKQENLKINLKYGNLSYPLLSKDVLDKKEKEKNLIQELFNPNYRLILNFTSLTRNLERNSFNPSFIQEIKNSDKTVLSLDSKNKKIETKAEKINRKDDEMLKFEDELDVKPHSSSNLNLLKVNVSKNDSTEKLISNEEEMNKNISTTTIKSIDNEDNSVGKKMKKMHLQMLLLKKKLKNRPDKFKTIKIKPPRLQKPNATTKLLYEKQYKQNKIGYASLVRARSVNLTDYLSDEKTFEKKAINNREQLDSSGSENRHIKLIMIHSYKKPAVERFSKRLFFNNQNSQLVSSAGQKNPIFVKLHGNRRVVNAEEAMLHNQKENKKNNQIKQNQDVQLNNQSNEQNKMNTFTATYQSGSSRYIPKLLLPKFIRPKMYSLNGFIPKPNMQKFTTTTTSSSLNVNSPNIGLTQFYRNKKQEKSLDKTIIQNDDKRKKYGSKSSTNSIDEYDLNTSGSATRKRQILFMKRKGFGFENEINSVKPKNNLNDKKKNKKQLKAIDFQFPKANYPKELLESLNIRPEAPKFEYPVLKKESIKDAKSGKNYPAYSEIPKTQFTCPENLNSGVFSDIETRCQVWHMCQNGRKHSFLCANGTVFNEKSGVCDWWYNVDCSPNSVKLTKLY